MWLALTLALSAPAHAACPVDALQTVIDFTADPPARVDTWTIGVEPGAAPCRRLALSVPEDASLVGVEAQVWQPDRGRPVQLGRERLWVPSGPWWSPPTPVLDLPEATLGSTIEARVTWRLHGPAVAWAPGEHGAVAKASLEVVGGRAVAAKGPLPGTSPWRWSDLPGDQPPLKILADSPAPVEAVPGAVVGPPVAWAATRAGAVVTLVDPRGRQRLAPAVDDSVSAFELTRLGISLFTVPAALPEQVPDPSLEPRPDAELPVEPAVAESGPPDPPGPGCLLREFVWTCAVEPGSWWRVPAGAAPAPAPPGAGDVRVTLVLDERRSLGPDEAPAGRTEVRGTWTSGVEGPPRGVTAPPGGTAFSCAAGTVPGRVRGASCWFPDADPAQPRTWTWTEPKLRVVGEVPRTMHGGPVRLTVEAPGSSPVSLVTGAATPSTSSPATSGVAVADGLAPVLADPWTWRIAQVGDTPVLPSRAVALDRVAYLALQASLPQPGLPLRYKNRLDKADLVPEILSLVRARMQPGEWSARGPLSPRRLRAALRSRWGTAWEQALLLSRYLSEVRLDAVPVPVRPVTRGQVEAATPVGFTAALVRVRESDGTDVWIAPDCQLCGPGELPPELGGAQALSRVAASVPPSPTGAVAVVARGAAVHVSLSGAAALQLRRALREHPPAERRVAIGAWLGAPPGVSVDVERLAERGAPVVVRLTPPAGQALDATRIGPALPRPAAQGSPRVALPWAGTWTRPASGPARERSAAGMRWSVRATADGRWVETLDVAERVVDRAEAASFFAAVHAERLTPRRRIAPAGETAPPRPARDAGP